MFKSIYKIIKRLVMSVLMIYAYNKIALPLNVIIPFNIATIFMVSLCGIPSVLVLVLFSLLCI